MSAVREHLARALDRTHANARERERAMFAVCWLLFHDGAAVLPPGELAELAGDEARLLGYLADVMVQRMRPPDRDDLKRLADRLRPAAESGWTDVSDGTRGTRPDVPGQNPLAREWGVAPALDLTRLQAEWHALAPADTKA